MWVNMYTPWQEKLADHRVLQYEKKLVEVIQKSDHSVVATFSDGSTAEGTHLVGCDGSRSRVREILCNLAGTISQNDQLDVRFLGCSAELPLDVVRQMKKLDPLFLQGHHPNGSFFFFGIQDTPVPNKTKNFKCQVNVSWPYCKGFMGRDHPVEVPDSQEARMALVQEIANHWTSPFQDVIRSIPLDTPLQEIKIEDWSRCDSGAWDNLKGRTTLMGDAAHAMTMYRGEAVNYAILDVKTFMESHSHTLSDPERMEDSQAACDAFEQKMIGRAKPAIGVSRKACLHAHYSKNIARESPLVSKRALA